MTKQQKLIFEIVVAILMIALLTGALVYYNAIDKIPETDLEQNDDNTSGDGDDVFIPTGSKVGFRCPTYDLQNVFDSNKTNVADLKGKVVVVNFWYTTCGPCVAELPYFNQIADNYADDVVVLIVHAAFDHDTTAPYLNETYPNTKMLAVFDEAVSGNNDYFYNKLGGKGTYPMTVILDENGIITHNVKKSISGYAELEGYVQEALA